MPVPWEGQVMTGKTPRLEQAEEASCPRSGRQAGGLAQASSPGPAGLSPDPQSPAIRVPLSRGGL